VSYPPEHKKRYCDFTIVMRVEACPRFPKDLQVVTLGAKIAIQQMEVGVRMVTVPVEWLVLESTTQDPVTNSSDRAAKAKAER
jgi:hypothetical protein